MNTRAKHRSAGFTIVEVVVSSALMAVLLLAVGLTTLSADKAFKAGAAQDRLTSKAQRAIERIVDEISMGGTTGLTPNPTAPLGSSTLSFRTPTGWTAGNTTWDGQRRIAFQYRAEDPNDGTDNDRNGYVDDGCIVLTRNVGLANEDATVLVNNVAEYLDGELPNGSDDNGNGLTDERGLSFVLSGDQLTIRVTVVGRDDNGRSVVRTVTTAVMIRN